MIWMKSTLLLVLAFAGLLLAQPDGNQILGIWNTDDGDSKIEIVKCGDNYCGSIKSMKAPRNDERNSNASLRNRPLVGVQILTGFKYAGSNSWTGGTLYAPKRGKAMSAKLKLSTQDSLDITVSAGVSSRTITWTRDK
jgi:uncharacterized protein (DUF2147 family)